MKVYNEEFLKDEGLPTVVVFSDIYFPNVGGVSTVVRDMGNALVGLYGSRPKGRLS